MDSSEERERVTGEVLYPAEDDREQPDREQPVKRRRQRSVTIPEGLITQSPPSQQPETPVGLVALAVQQNLDIGHLERLLELQQRWEAGEARKAFYAAISRFQSELPPICRSDKVDAGKAGRRKYASLGTINEAIRPYLYANGLSFRFRQHQGPDGITVTCVVSHKDGHSEETTLTAGADGSGGKNAIQSVGSTVTYLQRYTLVSALGLTTVEADDDGEQLPAVMPPASQGVAQPAAAPASTPPQQAAPSAAAVAKVMITNQQTAEMLGLMKELFSSGAKAQEWLLEGYGVNQPGELTSAEADGVLSALNMLKHQMVTPATLPQQETSADGMVTSAQRERIRDLTVAVHKDNAPQAQADWLRSLGLGSAQGLTYPQAADRIAELERMTTGGQAEGSDASNPF